MWNNLGKRTQAGLRSSLALDSAQRDGAFRRGLKEERTSARNELGLDEFGTMRRSNS